MSVWKKSRIYVRKAAAAALAAAVSVSAMGITALAAEPTDPKYIDKYVSESDLTFLSKNVDMIRAIEDGLLKHQSSINISSYKISPNYLYSIVDSITAVCPEMFFISRTLPFKSYYTTSDGNYISSLVPNYLYDETTTNSMLKEFYDRADFYLDQVSDMLSACRDDFSKAIVLHDELILDSNYQTNNTSTYTLMVNNYGLCENYSRVYAYLLSQVGIYSEIVDSPDEMCHEWVKVKIGDNYYHVDVTYDDPNPDRPGIAHHEYFLLSDSAISDHYGYEDINKSLDVKYDKAKYHNYTSKLCKMNSGETALYAVDSSSSSIVKYNYVSNSSEKVLSLGNLVWSAGGYSYWQGIYSGLDIYDGKLYYNSPDAIYSYDLTANKSEKVADNSYSKDFYGLRIRGNKLYGVIASNPNETGTEVLIKELTPSKVDVSSITLDKESLNLELGSSAYLTAAVLPENASDKTVTWTSSDSSVATVSSSLVKAVGEGTATITAKTSNGKTASCTVTVYKPTIDVTSVKFNRTAVTLEKSKTYTVQATVDPDNATDKTLTWVTSDKNVANVSNGVITAKNVGTCTISAKSSNGIKAKLTVTVVPVLRNTSVITNDVVQVGDKVRVSASGSGGTGTYTYAYYFKRSTNTSWKVLGTEYGTDSSVTFTPTAAASYDVKVVVKDSAGIKAEKLFTVGAVNELPLTNVSTINNTTIAVGKAIKMTGKAVGGASGYTYAFYFKRSTNTNWKTLGTGDFSTTASARLKPTAAAVYDVKIVVKDSAGNKAEKVFTVTAK